MMGELWLVAESYVSLLQSWEWGRETREGQTLLCGLRGYIARRLNLSLYEVQIAAEAEAIRRKEV